MHSFIYQATARGKPEDEYVSDRGNSRGPPTPLLWSPVPAILHPLPPTPSISLSPAPSIQTKRHVSHNGPAKLGTRVRSRWQPATPPWSPRAASRPQAPYLDTPVSATSTFPPHSTHPNVRHTHLPHDMIGPTWTRGKSRGQSRPKTYHRRKGDKAAARTPGD